MNQLSTFFKNFWDDEEGIETIEILLILSVLIVIALMFRDRIMDWIDSLFDTIEDELPGD
ncbi:Flp1 family type IVb pilin [Virgibacillus oceani]